MHAWFTFAKDTRILVVSDQSKSGFAKGMATSGTVLAPNYSQDGVAKSEYGIYCTIFKMELLGLKPVNDNKSDDVKSTCCSGV